MVAIASDALAADEARAGLHVAPRQLGRPRDADSRAGDHVDRAVTLEELERWTVERQAVVLARDPERLTEPARAAAQEPRILDAAALAHDAQAVRRLKRAHEDRVGDAHGLADAGQGPVDAVGAVHVGVSGRPEHRGVARRAAAVAVARRVFVVVRF